MRVLEAGFEDQDRPCVLLLHGSVVLVHETRLVVQVLQERAASV
jgi:hypothetical protein